MFDGNLRRVRVTAQTRLTITYAALFFVSGAALAIFIITLTLWPLTAATPTGLEPSPQKPVEAKLQVAAAALEAKAQARHELRVRLIAGSGIGLAAMTVVAGAGGWVMAGRVLRPVHAVSGTARRLSQRNLHERIPVGGPRDEMRELAETFNDMLARLEDSFEAQRRFAANASHELRGPMTTQRTLVEVTAAAPDASEDVRQLAAALRHQLDRQERLVDGLLALAASEHGAVELTPVRLDELVSDCLAALPASDVTVRSQLAHTTVTGDQILLDLLLSNLLRNAVQHNMPRGQLWVETGPGRLTVANTGPEVTTERLAELIEPFRRGHRDRVGSTGGAGLGLAIATAAAAAHHATLSLAPRPGGGVCATVRFPDQSVIPG
ncbi:HAMP domain-containing sensor histidine kinase [Dactylosporangium sp. NPDC049140]|uniref:sensor histidine kinase n=1 Tax=Dactylosporangium sp. NPDC049140 TaxID=3155647 RepID=UPI0033E5D26C